MARALTMHQLRLIPDDTMSEDQLQTWIIYVAEIHGWWTQHTYKLRTKFGWRTAHIRPGYPDLTLVRDSVIFAELKSEAGLLSKDQMRWIAHLMVTAGQETYIWKPSDRAAIEERLTRKST